MRICSLLPSATEILFALGLGNEVVAVTHECDYPAQARTKPRVTTSVVDPSIMSSCDIDRLISRTLAGAGGTYHLDMEILRRAHPDLLVTQQLCAVCAVDGDEVRRAAALLDPPPRILSLEPSRLPDVLACIRVLGEETGVLKLAEHLASTLAARMEAVRAATAQADRPRVLCVEWLDPPWIAGHWMPEIVELAGGVDVLGAAGQPSRRATWAEMAQAAPEVVILMPCGFEVERTLAEVHVLRTIPEISRIHAFQTGQVYAVDGSSYYNRPGPRLADGVEILASILHPDLFPQPAPLHAARRLSLRKHVPGALPL